jgi:hypothetical protein
MARIGQVERGRSLLGAPERLEIVGAGHIGRQPRLDADDDVAVAYDRPAREVHIGFVEVHQLAAGRDACPRDVDEEAAEIGPGPCDGSHLIDVVGAG